jgi:hypothetical protein
MLGVVALPRPLEGEVVLKLGRWWAFGVKGSLLPTLSVPGLDASLTLRAVEGTARWFPFHGTFFLGAGLGYQVFKGSIGQTIDNGELTVSADMSGPFISPQIGWLWISDSGFAIGVGLGVQIPFPKDPVVDATYNGQPVPAQATTAAPSEVVDQAHASEDTIRSAAKVLMKYPFPNLDLLRIGIFF